MPGFPHSSNYLCGRSTSAGSNMVVRLEKDRCAELARFEAGKLQRISDGVFHAATLGLYTHRAADSGSSELLDEYRQVDYYLTFLDGLAAAGTQPEVAYDSSRIRYAIIELSLLLPNVQAGQIRQHASHTIERLRDLSADSQLKAECVAALDSLRGAPVPALGGQGETETLR
jgi:hypothetical protein